MNLLAPFGRVYGRGMDLRNLLYDRELLKSYDLGARTISVGNLTTGGTGKTPLVALIARILIDEGGTVCILTRGYGRNNPRERVLVSDGTKVLVEAGTGGDEPVDLAHKLGGKAIIVADRDRVAAAKWARENFNVTAFILDDGFQHRRARRDLDIVCIDATNPCGNGRILPAGTLRESFKGLKRADAIVITRAEQVTDTSELERRLRDRNQAAPIFKARTESRSVISIEEFLDEPRPSRLPEVSMLAFTGIGNPKSFFRSLELSGLRTVAERSFSDHHQYTQNDIQEIERQALETNAEAFVTTSKDAVKLKDLRFSRPCYVVCTDTTIDDLSAFRDLVIPRLNL